MTLPIVWLSAASAELTDAASWYAEIRPELGRRFVQAVDDAILVISAGPTQFVLVDKNRRRAGIRRFPYSIIFIVEPARILVIACFHGKRNPRQWRSRSLR